MVAHLNADTAVVSRASAAAISASVFDVFRRCDPALSRASEGLNIWRRMGCIAKIHLDRRCSIGYQVVRSDQFRAARPKRG